MATLEESIKTYILTQTAITAYVGQDVYHAANPDIQSDYIRYQLTSPSNEPYAFDNTNTAQPEVQFDIFSRNDASVIAIGNLLVTALNRFTGSLATGTTVIYSTASGPMVTRDRSDDEWFHGIVYWTPEYER